MSAVSSLLLASSERCHSKYKFSKCGSIPLRGTPAHFTKKIDKAKLMRIRQVWKGIFILGKEKHIFGDMGEFRYTPEEAYEEALRRIDDVEKTEYEILGLLRPLDLRGLGKINVREILQEINGWRGAENQKLRLLLGLGKLEKAFDLVGLEDDAVLMLHTRWQRNEEAFQDGIKSLDDRVIENNKIIKAWLKILKGGSVK
ncbi:MAG: hypothetical protein AAF927_24450 [Bacteroidota bacterium]